MDSIAARLQDELNAAIGGATEAALQNAPAGKWSSAQIIEHLFLTYKVTNKAIARCLENGAPLASRPTIQHRAKNFVVTRLGFLPEGAKSPQRAQPQGMALAEVRGAIFSELEKMFAGLADCERQFGARAKIMDHPVLGPLTAEEWRKFHWLHGRLHARQIRERARL